MILASDGNLYGTTERGGITSGFTSCGTIFKISPTTYTESIIHFFGNPASDGTAPISGLLEYPAGSKTMYGVTESGGANGGGMAYSYAITSSTYTDIYDLTLSPNLGYSPLAVELVGTNVPLCGALPITLANFNVKCNNGQALLTWASATETNNNYYTIDITEDGITYRNVAIVKGAGNSSFAINYSYTDPNPPPGISYYRLSQTDYDGTTVHLKTDSYTPCENASSIYAFAKNGTITLEISSPSDDIYTVQLINALGQIVLTKNYNTTIGFNSFDIDTHIASGIYIIQVMGKEKTYTKKLLLGNINNR